MDRLSQLLRALRQRTWHMPAPRVAPAIPDEAEPVIRYQGEPRGNTADNVIRDRFAGVINDCGEMPTPPRGLTQRRKAARQPRSGH